MSNPTYAKGLHDLGNGIYGYLQPDGTWGWSNAGLIESQGATLLVDTLMTVGLTRDMLDEMRRKVPAARRIDRLVNTHANIDHFAGNELVKNAEIIAATATAEDIAKTNVGGLARLFANAATATDDAGAFLYQAMGSKFDLRGIELTPPNRTFDGQLDLRVGDKTVQLIDLGPAHTRADTIVFVPADKVLFTGDLLFHRGTPIMWAGPVQHWIAACDRMLALDADVIVPGHGPLADKQALRNQKAYFEYVRDEARKRYEAGMAWEDAAHDILLGDFARWSDAERLAANVHGLYKEFGATELANDNETTVFAAMARWHAMAKARHAQGDHSRCNHL